MAINLFDNLFDIEHSPELAFPTNTNLSDKFPKNVGQGEWIIHYSMINLNFNVARHALIIDDCLIQFDDYGNIYVLNIPNNTLHTYDFTSENLFKWIKNIGLIILKMENTMENNQEALYYLNLYATFLFYHTTQNINKSTYTNAMKQLRKGFGLDPNDEAIRITNRKWYYYKERKTWGNIALNIFRDYFKDFTTYSKY